MNYDIDNITPITTQTWSSNKTVIGKVIIPSGQTLTISNCTIEFADSKRVNVDTKIVIEQGGRLIINNSTLTSIQSCEKQCGMELKFKVIQQKSDYNFKPGLSVYYE